MRTFRRLCIATTAAAVSVATIGAVVRSSGSGLGCPDWPRCHGRWIPPLEAKALIEYSHRLSVSLLSILGLVVVGVAWLKFRRTPSIVWPALAALGVVVVQAWVGRLVVLHELPEGLVAIHFFLALSLLAMLTVLTTNAFRPRGGVYDRTTRTALLAGALVFAALMAGAFVSQAGAALVFPDWPLMESRFLPDLSRAPAVAHFAHRILAAVAGIALIWAAYAMRRDPRSPIRVLSRVAPGLWALQAAAGALNIFTRSAAWAVVLHVFLASLLWVTTVALAAVAYRLAGPASSSAEPTPSTLRATSLVRAYFLLTKPRIIELLVITTVPTMMVAARGWPPIALVLATIFGGALAAGSANAINCYLDRDIDERMPRTSSRPLPRHEVEPSSALRFGVALGVLGIGWLALAVNPLSAGVALGAILFYVFVYTLALKRLTPSNIVIGGAAGAVPVLVGWAAVTGKIEAPAIVAFAIIFYWTPPHFWALSLRYSDEYAAAGVPMLPVVRGPGVTSRHIFLYSWALVGMSLLMAPVGHMGWVYLASAAALGGGFLLWAARLKASPEPRAAMSLFRYSVGYLTLLFVAMGADGFFGGPLPGAFYSVVASISAGTFFLATSGILLAAFRWRAEGIQSWRSEVGFTALPALAAGLLFAAYWRL